MDCNDLETKKNAADEDGHSFENNQQRLKANKRLNRRMLRAEETNIRNLA